MPRKLSGSYGPVSDPSQPPACRVRRVTPGGKFTKISGNNDNNNKNKENPEDKEKVPKLDKRRSIKTKTRISVTNQPTNQRKPAPTTMAPSHSSTHLDSVPNGSKFSTGQMHVGCHMSAAGGVHNAVLEAVKVGAKSFALFLRPQRTWAAPPLSPEVVLKFRTLCSEHSFPPHLILPHGSYLLNLGSPKQEQRDKSLTLLVEELTRCDSLGLEMFNIHPGSSCGEISRDEAVAFIAEGINKAHSLTRGSRVKVVLENMSKQGHTLGGDLVEIKQIIDQVSDQTRVGVCLDTCHAMAAGYDLSTAEGFDRLCEEFGRVVGWRWLVGAHINDSQGPAGCHRDRHANIGKGTIGVEGFRRVLNSPHFADIPLILETPPDTEKGLELYTEEIQLLQSLVANGH